MMGYGAVMFEAKAMPGEGDARRSDYDAAV